MNTYQTRGTCSRAIQYEINAGIVTECYFVGGCMGNTQGVAALVKGMRVEEAVARLNGIKCGARGTSCPDQRARALEQHL